MSTLPENVTPEPGIEAPEPKPSGIAPLSTPPSLGVGEKEGDVFIRLGDLVARLTPEQAIAAGRDIYQRGERLKREARKALAKRVGKHEAARIEKAEGK